MRRLLAAAIIAALPLAAAAQSLPADTHAMAQRLLAQPPDQMAQVGQGVSVPLWRGASGNLLMLRADTRESGESPRLDAPLSFSVVDARSALSSGLQYQLAPSLQAHAQITEHSFANSPLQVQGSELGATYNARPLQPRRQRRGRCGQRQRATAAGVARRGARGERAFGI